MSENNQVVEYTTTVDESVIGLPKLVWCMAWLAWCGFFANRLHETVVAWHGGSGRLLRHLVRPSVAPRKGSVD